MGKVIRYADKSRQRRRGSGPGRPIPNEKEQIQELEDKAGAWSEIDIGVHKQLLLNLIKSNEYSFAKIVARHITDLLPEDSYAWFLRGVAYLELSDPRLAEKFLLRSIEISGKSDAWCCQKMSHARLLQGDPDGAIEWCTRAIDLKPDESLFRWRLIEIHKIRNDLESAIKAAMAASGKVTEPPDKVRAYMVLANLYVSSSALNKAEKQIRKALNLEGENAEIWTSLGECLLRQKKNGEALKAFQRAAELDPGNAHRLYDVGDAHIAIGQPDQAIAVLEEVIKRRHDYKEAHYHLSLAHLRLKNYMEAEKSARTALHYNTDTQHQQVSFGIAAMENLGIALTKQGRFEEAEKSFRSNLSHVKLTYYNLGLMFFWMKRYSDALENFQRALELDPQNPEFNNLVGDTYDEMGQYDEAEKHFRRAVEIDKSYAMGHCDLGVFLSRRRGLKKEALASFELALKIQPEDSQIYYGIACTYALSQEEGLALKFLEEAFRKGFREFDHIEKDSDWDGLRTKTKFTRLIERYRNIKKIDKI